MRRLSSVLFILLAYLFARNATAGELTLEELREQLHPYYEIDEESGRILCHLYKLKIGYWYELEEKPGRVRYTVVGKYWKNGECYIKWRIDPIAAYLPDDYPRWWGSWESFVVTWGAGSPASPMIVWSVNIRDFVIEKYSTEITGKPVTGLKFVETYDGGFFTCYLSKDVVTSNGCAGDRANSEDAPISTQSYSRVYDFFVPQGDIYGIPFEP